ncbi:hypothetical protein KVV02_000999, partial [Mortierella alpina]
FQSLGYIYLSYPALMNSAQSIDIMDTVFTGQDDGLKTELLHIYTNFLLKIQIAPASEEGRKAGYSLIAKAEDQLEAGIGSSIMQRYLERVLQCALVDDRQLQCAAVDVVSQVTLQALAHPMLCMPAIVALETSVDRLLSERAFKIHQDLHQKHASLIYARSMDCIKTMYIYQKSVQREKADVQGYKVIPETGNSVALLSRMYSLVSDKRQARNSLLSGLVKILDVDLAASEIEVDGNFVRFIAENLSSLEYRTMEEVYLVIFFLNRIIAGSGMTLLVNMTDVSPAHTTLTSTNKFSAKSTGVPQKRGRKHSRGGSSLLANLKQRNEMAQTLIVPGDESGEDIMDGFQSGEDVPPPSPKAVQSDDQEPVLSASVMCRASVAIEAAIHLKNHLKRIYDISEVKCQQFQPNAHASHREKPVPRFAGALARIHWHWRTHEIEVNCGQRTGVSQEVEQALVSRQLTRFKILIEAEAVRVKDEDIPVPAIRTAMKSRMFSISSGRTALLLVLYTAALAIAVSETDSKYLGQNDRHPSRYGHHHPQSHSHDASLLQPDQVSESMPQPPPALLSSDLDEGAVADKTTAELHKVMAVDFRSPTDDHSYGASLRADHARHRHEDFLAMDILDGNANVVVNAHGRTNVNKPVEHNAEAVDPCLLFEDNFDRLDNSIWKHDLTMTGGGNFEFQLYINNRSITFVKDGIFYIRPTLTEARIGAGPLRDGGVLDMWGMDPGTRCTGNYNYGCFRVAGAGGNYLNPIQSGLVRTVDSFKFRYGKVQVRAKMPKGKWIWPAIWMLPVHYQYGNWPASGEIDLVESRGNGPEYEAGGHDQVSSTLHWGPSYEFNRYPLTHANYSLPDGSSFSDDFHVFTLDWRPEGLKTYVDDHLVLNVAFDDMYKKGKFPSWVDNPWKGSTTAPFDQEFYIIMNVAVGGASGYFPDNVGGKPWSDKSQHAVNEFYDSKDDWYPSWGPEDGLDRAMAVDYIRVFKYNC